MTEVVVVCEGRTEEAFINEVVQPALAENAVYFYPRLIPTSGRSKGGALTGQRVVASLSQALRERDDAYVTTFFDLYGLPGDFPGRQEAHGQDPIALCEQVEMSLHRIVAERAQRRGDRFVPHIQPHEFEALLLADPSAFPRVVPTWGPAETELAQLVDAAASPEHVNDGSTTHPSAQLKRLLPGYRKVAHGVGVATAIGLERIRAECHHFAQWLGRMEALPPLQSTRMPS